MSVLQPSFPKLGRFGGSEALKKQIQSVVLLLWNHCQLFSSGVYVFFFLQGS